MPTTGALSKSSVGGIVTLVSRETSRLWKRMPVEEFPHHRTRFEVSDAVGGPASRSASRVFRPAMAHAGDRAELHFDAVAAGLVRHACGRPHAVRLDGRAGATVAVCPAGDVG